MTTETKCPVTNGANGARTPRARSNRDWWPQQLNLEILHQNSPLADPMGEELDYAEALDWHGLRFAPSDDPSKAWTLEVRPGATDAQKGHLADLLAPSRGPGSR